MTRRGTMTAAMVGAVMVIGPLAACGDDGAPKAAAAATRPFCAVATDVDTRFRGLDESSSPDDVRAAIDDVDVLLGEAIEVAPAELAADVGLVVAAQRQMLERVRTSGYDLEAFWTPLAQDESFVFPEEAEARLDAYLSGTCGIDVDE